MKNFILKNKLTVYFISIILGFSFVFTILEYIGLSFKISSILLNIASFVICFFFSYINSFKSNIEGYKSGFRNGIKIWVILLLMNLFTLNKFDFKLLIYYLIIMIISILAGIISKNKQKNSSS